jgi:hypothetical protein
LPDIAVTLTWNLDLRQELPLFFEELYARLLEIGFISNWGEFQDTTFWFEILLHDQNVRNLVDVELNVDEGNLQVARLHAVFMAHDPLSRAWCLFEFGARIDAVKSEFRLLDSEVLAILAGDADPQQMRMSHRDWTEHSVASILTKRFPLLIAREKLTDMQADLRRYESADAFSRMRAFSPFVQLAIQERLLDVFPSADHFNLLLQVRICLRPALFVDLRPA